MGTQTVLQLFIGIFYTVRDFSRFIMVIFQNVINSFLGDDAFISQKTSLLIAYDCRGHTED